jgi:hypothetical protein
MATQAALHPVLYIKFGEPSQALHVSFEGGLPNSVAYGTPYGMPE